MSDIDWEDLGRDLVIGGLDYVPEVGAVLSAFVDFLWPPAGTSVWDEIRAKVEELIAEKIADYAYGQVTADLDGLRRAFAKYLKALNEPTSPLNYIVARWVDADGLFDALEAKFRLSDYQVLFLPLFAQFVNLRLFLLVDYIRYGHSWGMSTQNVADVQEELEDSIKGYTAYAQATDAAGYQKLVSQTGTDNKTAQPFRALNRYSREMTLMVRDFVALWPYYDKAHHDLPPDDLLNREIYSDPYGHPGDGRLINIPTTLALAPTGLIRGLEIWGDNHVCALRVAYTGGGPGGTSDTGRMGTPDGYGSSLPPRGGKFPVAPDNPITVVSPRSGLIVDGLSFGFRDGTGTRLFGGGSGGPGSCGYTDHILSSITVTGWDLGYRCVECAVFGFKLSPAPKPKAQVLEMFAVTAPKPLANYALTETHQTQRAGYFNRLASFASSKD